MFTTYCLNLPDGILLVANAKLDDYDLLQDEFGLVDKKGGWSALKQIVQELNQESDSLTAYKLMYIARHGEGWHNVAEAKYGSEQWNCVSLHVCTLGLVAQVNTRQKWSMLDGDGNITWGPDPPLTPKGEGQARAVNAAWHTQIAAGVPLPQSLYASPLQRSLRTLQITWSDILLDSIKPTIREHWRETIGIHTCDKRRDKTAIAADFPGFQFEQTFSEHDELWNEIYQEPPAQQALRIQQALDEVFATDSNPYISITAHSGVM